MINQGLNERIFDTFVTQLGFNLPTYNKSGLNVHLRLFNCLIIQSNGAAPYDRTLKQPNNIKVHTF